MHGARLHGVAHGDCVGDTEFSSVTVTFHGTAHSAHLAVRVRTVHHGSHWQFGW